MRPHATDLIGCREAAGILKRSVATVKRQARKGELPTVAKAPGMTGAYLFVRSEIEAVVTGTLSPDAAVTFSTAPTSGDAA
jgi:hypothetical protein